MKSIIYILIAVFISSILFSAIPKSFAQKKQILKIQCVDDNFNSGLLSKSNSIISNRLKSYGLKNFKIIVLKDKNVIVIETINNVDLNELLPLITSKGKLEFYETVDRSEVIPLLAKDTHLYSIMNISMEEARISKPNASAVLGYFMGDEREVITNYVDDLSHRNPEIKDVLFSWGQYPVTDSMYELFLLNKHSNLGGDKVNKAIGRYYKNGKADINLSFTDEGAEIWRDMTKRNIGKTIAIVIDGKVYYAPVVKSEIKEGTSQISGDFSINEVKMLVSLLNNGELPLHFKLIK